MKIIKLSDINLLDIGNKIQMAGAVYSGNGTNYLILFPDENLADFEMSSVEILDLTLADWEKFLYQTDVLEVQLPNKSILRKSQRQIDQAVSWAVYKRDDYKCRYCGKDGVLTVDHIDLWEDGGRSIQDNLIAACRPCNKTRGNMKYKDWLESDAYKQRSMGISDLIKNKNANIIHDIPRLETLRTTIIRSR